MPFPQVQAPTPQLQIGSGASPFKSASFLPGLLPSQLSSPGGSAATINGTSPNFNGPSQFGALPSYPLDPNVAQAMSGLNRPGPGNAGFNFHGMKRGNNQQAGQTVGGGTGIQQSGNTLFGASSGGQSMNPFTNRHLLSESQLAGLDSGELMWGGGRSGPQSLAGMFGPQGSPSAGGGAGPSQFAGGSNGGGVQPNEQSLQGILQMLAMFMGGQQ